MWCYYKILDNKLLTRSTSSRPNGDISYNLLVIIKLDDWIGYILGSPVNTLEFLRPFLRSLDYDLPKFTISVPAALSLAKIFQGVYTLLYPWLSKSWLPQPLILPAEVYKVGVTHYFSYLKAKEELGYVPFKSSREGMAATISYWQERKQRSLEGPTIFTWLAVMFGMLVLFAAGWVPDIGPVPFFRALCLFFFRTITVVKVVFIVSVLAHVAEAIYALSLAKRVDPDNAVGWFWQTSALGIFSMRFLLKRARDQRV